MYNLLVIFRATLSDPKYEEGVARLFKTGLSSLQEILDFRHRIDFYPIQTSEEQYIYGASDTRVEIHIQATLKQLANYYHVSLLFQGYFGMMSSTNYFHSVSVHIGTF